MFCSRCDMQRRMIRMTPARRRKKKGGFSMKSIGMRILVSCILTVAISLFTLGGFACIMTYNSTVSLVNSSMTASAQVAADRAYWEMRSYTNIASELGTMSQLSDSSTTDSELSEIVQQIIERHELQSCNIIKPNGNCLDGYNYSDREYFQNAMKGNVTVTEPTISRLTGELMLIIAAPIWKNGITGGEVAGCVIIVPDPEFLNDIVRSIKVSDNCGAYIIDKNGNTIADLDSEIVKRGENIEQLAAADTSGQAGYKTLAKAHESMRAGESGVAEYTLNGVSKFLAYAPIQDSNGWSLAIYAPTGDFMDSTYRAILLTVILLIVACVVSAIISILIGKKQEDRLLHKSMHRAYREARRGRPHKPGSRGSFQGRDRTSLRGDKDGRQQPQQHYQRYRAHSRVNVHRQPERTYC